MMTELMSIFRSRKREAKITDDEREAAKAVTRQTASELDARLQHLSGLVSATLQELQSGHMYHPDNGEIDDDGSGGEKE